MSYILVNPMVHEEPIKSTEKQSGGAAQDIWDKLSSNIKQYTPKFYFSIQDVKKNKLLHYKVKESMENGKVKYVISQYKNVDENLPTEDMKGGKRKKHRDRDSDDSSSSSSSSNSSSSDNYVYYPNSKSRRRRNNNGVSVTYYPSIYGVSNVLLPTFSPSYIPYGLNLSLGYYPPYWL